MRESFAVAVLHSSLQDYSIKGFARYSASAVPQYVIPIHLTDVWTEDDHQNVRVLDRAESSLALGFEKGLGKSFEKGLEKELEKDLGKSFEKGLGKSFEKDLGKSFEKGLHLFESIPS